MKTENKAMKNCSTCNERSFKLSWKDWDLCGNSIIRGCVGEYKGMGDVVECRIIEQQKK